MFNYISAIIIAIIYVLALYSDALSDLIFFFSTLIGVLLFPFIISGIIYFFRKKDFSKTFFWLTLIMCILSYYGSSRKDSSIDYKDKNYIDYDESKIIIENKKSIIHLTKQPYDSSANIFKSSKYTNENLFKIIEILDGPVSFRKENNTWYVYAYNVKTFYTGNRFKVFRYPVDFIYKKYNSWQDTLSEEYSIFSARSDAKIFDPENNFSIPYIDHIDHIVHAYCSYRKGDFENCKLLSDDINIKDFGFNVNNGTVNGSAIAYNTTNSNIKNIKIKISVYTKSYNGELITEDIYVINEALMSGQMKIININYSPNKIFEAKVLTPMNIEILEYDKF